MKIPVLVYHSINNDKSNLSLKIDNFEEQIKFLNKSGFKTVSFEEMTIDVYNSRAYLAGKHAWEAITLNLREDVNNNVQKLVGEQLQKQFDFYEQSSAASGQDYKFTTRIEILDGGNGANTPNILETFELYGCFVQNAAYNQLAYSANEPVTVTLAIRYDNAIQTPEGTGIGTAVGRTTNTLVTGGGV